MKKCSSEMHQFELTDPVCVVCTQTKLQSNMLQNLITEIEIFTAENNKTKKEQKKSLKVSHHATENCPR